MKVFWFIYSTFMCAPAILVAYAFYKIQEHGSITFNEPILLIGSAETICAFTLGLLAVAGWIIATILLFKKRGVREIAKESERIMGLALGGKG